MLASVFFVSVFSSIIWVFYVLSHVSGDNFNDFVVTAAVIAVPIFILWTVFGYAYQYISASVLNKNMYSLFKQMKKNQEYSDLIAKLLLDAGQDLRDNVILSKFDVFVADMNELLSEIIQRGHLASAEQIDNLWVKVKNGGKWSFGKVIIELNQNQPNLSGRLLQKSLQDAVLGGTILEFCSRYQSLISSLEKHDKERIFLNVIESGVFGKVFSLLAGPADSVRQNRDLTLTRSQMIEEDTPPEPELRPVSVTPSSVASEVAESGLSDSARRLFVNTFTRRKKETPQPQEKRIEETDPLSLAFAKSFGSAEPAAEPHFEESYLPPVTEDEEIPPEPNVVIEEQSSVKSEEKGNAVVDIAGLEQGFLTAQERIADVKKEWENIQRRDLSVDNVSEEEGMPEPKVGNDDEYSYPFGGWTNADKYDK